MKRWENLTIDGVDFRVDTKSTAIAPNQVDFRDVDDCYLKPSIVKRAIFEGWFKFFVEHEGWCTISSYNCMTFTLDGILEHEGKLYRAYITKTRQELTPIA